MFGRLGGLLRCESNCLATKLMKDCQTWKHKKNTQPHADGPNNWQETMSQNMVRKERDRGRDRDRDKDRDRQKARNLRFLDKDETDLFRDLSMVLICFVSIDLCRTLFGVEVVFVLDCASRPWPPVLA